MGIYDVGQARRGGSTPRACDETTPADLARDCAARIPHGEVAEYECGHFSVHLDPLCSTVADRECEFLCRHLAATPG